MNPVQRKAFQDTIDQAISLGAVVTVNIHPSHFDDESPIRSLMFPEHTTAVPGEEWVTFEFGSWRSTVTLFDAPDRAPRPSVPNGRSWDVV